MDIEPSQANIRSAGEEISLLLRNRNVYYSTEKSAIGPKEF